MNKVILKYGELFSGPGGLAWGATHSSVFRNGKEYIIKHSWANDYDEDTCATYRKNISPEDPSSVICGDIRKINLKKLPKIDILAFGFPCNDFSVVGKQKGFNGTFGPLYTYGVKILNLQKPKCFVAENVSGLRSANEGFAFKKILHDLESAGNGYYITAHIYKFEEYGVPQKRHRVVIVGFDKKLGLNFDVPVPTNANNYVSVKHAFTVPPIGKNATNNELTTQSETVIARLKHIKPGENAWNADLPKSLQLNVRSARMSQIYKRLHPEQPAYTVTGSGGGGTHIYHWKEDRALTNRERARLQSFPDSFEFIGSKESVRKQIGMAVPPKAAEIIFSSILKKLAGVSYSQVDSNQESVLQEMLVNKKQFALGI